MRWCLALFVCAIFMWANPYKPYRSMQKDSTTQYDSMNTLAKCANGDQQACARLLSVGIPNPNECAPHVCHLVGAVLSANGEDMRAIPYLKQSCQAQAHQGCTLLGILYQSQRNTQDSEQAYNIACNHGDSLGCHNLGVLQAQESKQNGKAAQSFARACSLHYPDSCYNLAVLYARRQELEMALYAFYVACDYGMTQACLHAQELRQSGVRLPALKKQRGLYVRIPLQ